MNTNELIARIIPPDDYSHRNAFSNRHIIDNLADNEKNQIEDILIRMLEDKNDTLIIETLGYMRSISSLTILNDTLDSSSDPMFKIIVASSIYEIAHDASMIAVAIKEFSHLADNFQKIGAFYYLSKLKCPDTQAILESYANSPDYLLAYNAKQALSN